MTTTESATAEGSTGEGSTGGVVVAVDLGGTLTKIAYVSRDGSATDVRRVDTVLDDQGAVPPEWLAGLVIEASTGTALRPACSTPNASCRRRAAMTG